MATLTRLPSGSWRAQVRRKGRYVSHTFVRREDAGRWARQQECSIDRGEAPTSPRARGATTFGQLIDGHVADMCEVGKAPGRSKDARLVMLKRELGKLRPAQLDREQVIQFGRRRAAQGAGPVTLSMDVGAIRLVLSHAAAVHGLPVSVEQIDLGRIALKRLGLVGKSNQRDHRPTEDELARLIAHFEDNPRQLIPMGRIIKFAVATAMRQEEICRVKRPQRAHQNADRPRSQGSAGEEGQRPKDPSLGRPRLRRHGPDRGAARGPRQARLALPANAGIFADAPRSRMRRHGRCKCSWLSWSIVQSYWTTGAIQEHAAQRRDW
jgi:integrase